MSSLQIVARIKNREDAKTLHQEFDKSRFDNSWTDPMAIPESGSDCRNKGRFRFPSILVGSSRSGRATTATTMWIRPFRAGWRNGFI